MIDDNFNEQEQWDRVKGWMRDNGLWLLTGVLIGVLGLVGWQWWQKRVETQAQAASSQYQQVLEALEREDRTRAFTLIDQLRADQPRSPYADQADLVAARVNVEANELQLAAERLARVMNGTRDEQLKLIVRARLARVQAGQGNFDLALGTLAAAPAGAFAARFTEVRGDVLLAKGDKPGALAAYLKAQQEDTEGTLDTAALDLKIADLRADGVVEPTAAAAAPTPAAAAPGGAAPVAAPPGTSTPATATPGAVQP